jgi:hypothetical protein
MISKFLVGLLFVGTMLGQKAAKPNLVASAGVENKILKAEHVSDQANLIKQQAEAQFAQLKQTWLDADTRSKDADKSVQAAIDEAYKENGLSKDDYNFDPANFTFSAKPKPVAKTPDLKKP